MVSGPLVSGVASLIVGIIAVIIGVVISQSVKTAIREGIESAVTIKKNTSANYESWKTNTAGSSAPALRSYYMYNITNIDSVVAGASQPTYEEIGPFVYQYLYEKIDVKLNKTSHSAKYRTYGRYIFRDDLSVSSDTVNIVQVNPAYILAAYTNTDPANPANPKSATELGVFASIVSGVFAQVDSQVGSTSQFPNLIRTNYFQPTFKVYRDLLVSYVYGGSYADFVYDMTTTVTNYPWNNCTLVPAAAVKYCGMYNTIHTYSPAFTGVTSSVIAKLLDDTNPGGLMHPNNLWIKAMQNAVNGSPNTLFLGPAAASVGASSTEVGPILAWINAYFANQQLTIIRDWLKWGNDFYYQNAGYYQFATLTPLNGLSLRHQNPSTAFYPDFAGFVKYEQKAQIPAMSTTAAKNILTGVGSFPGLKDAKGVGYMMSKAAILLNPANVAHVATYQSMGFENFSQVSLFFKYIVHLYQNVMTPLCNQMNTKGNCFYRRTSVQNLLFGTLDDPMITFFKKGEKTRAGIFTNNTNYEDARHSNINGDRVDTGYHDVDDIGVIYEINGANNIVRPDGVTDSWSEAVPITGRNVQFPPYSSKGYTQTIFSSSLYRNFQLKKRGDATVKGIDMRHFEVDPANNYATDENYKIYHIRYDGVMDYSKTELVSGAPNIPILATNPRLVDANQTIFQNIDCTVKSVDSEGEPCFLDELSYNDKSYREKYVTNFYVEPLTGVPMKGTAVVQFWLYVDPVVKASVFGLKGFLTAIGSPVASTAIANNRIPTAPIPVCYLRDHSELTDDNADEFKNTVYAAQDMGKTIGVALPVIGAFLIVFAFALLYWHVRLIKAGDSVNKP